MDKRDASTLGRRAFLRRLGAGATAALATGGALRERAAADTHNDDPKRRARFRETEHVKTFYRVNRYPK